MLWCCGLHISSLWSYEYDTRQVYAFQLYIVTYPGFAWLIRRVLDVMIEFIGALYNWLQQFTNHYLTHCLLLPTGHSTATIRTSSWTELPIVVGFTLYSLGSDHKNTSYDTGSIVACVNCGRCLEMGVLYCWLSVCCGFVYRDVP
jgi:hypothetical protein